MGEVIDGKARAAALRESIADRTATLAKNTGIQPGLAVVIVGDDPASQVYVRNKGRQAEAAGFYSETHRLSDAVSNAELLSKVDELNADSKIHGILVQLPLPAGLDPDAVIERIDPNKDVDGFHPINVGRLALGQTGFVPCTPLGCQILLRETLGDLSGLNAVVVGRSNIVGKPMAQLLLEDNATVTITHSRTANLDALCRQADILIAAVGRAQMVKGDWIKPGATVIDVGINRIDTSDGKTRLVGDVEFEAALDKAAFVTPVPGGVGPMTIACLLENTFRAAARYAALMNAGD